MGAPINTDNSSHFEHELLRESVRSRFSQSRTAFLASLVVVSFLIFLPLGGAKLYIVAWWSGIAAILCGRFIFARYALEAIDRTPFPIIRRWDTLSRTLSIATQAYVGAGIWIAMLDSSRATAIVLTTMIMIFGAAATINLRSDFRSFQLSMPLLFGQPLLFWISQTPVDLVAVLALLGMFILMYLFASSLRQYFRDTVTLASERNRLMEQLANEKAALDRALEIAESASRAKTFFLAAASHDLRQPLYAISMLNDTLSLHSLPNDARSLVERQQAALSALVRLFDNLLDFAKFESGVVEAKLANFRIDDLISSICEDYRPACIAKNLSIEAPPTGKVIRSDYDLLSRLIRNLVSNAVQYTDSGGIEVYGETVDERLVICIKDSGAGISEQDQSRVFERFLQLRGNTASNINGAGLGLAIVRHISNIIDVKIQIRSSVGRGTEIRVVLSESACTDDLTIN